MTAREQLEILKTNAVDFVSEAELLSKLQTGQPLRIKYGADPSAPDLHLGHSVPIDRLRVFQELGHTVVFIIGDFTGRIGDPSGRSKTRPMLTVEQIETNARTYAQQVSKILDMDRCELHYNSTWFETLGADGLLKLAARYTVARMLERDDFAQRMSKEIPVSVCELLYPLVQAYDSVMIKADVEIGGTDQLFNFLVGRDIMRAYDLPPQVVMTWPLLVGTDGTEKMSKSLGNYVGITEPPGEMFGKLMSIPDAAMPTYYRLLLNCTEAHLSELTAGLASGRLHPRDAKADLAAAIVQRYHDPAAAADARAEFDKVFAQRELPSEMPEIMIGDDDRTDEGVWIIRLLLTAGFAATNGEARRLVRGGGVRVEGEVITDEMKHLPLQGGEVVQVGKRRVGRIQLS